MSSLVFDHKNPIIQNYLWIFNFGNPFINFQESFLTDYSFQISLRTLIIVLKVPPLFPELPVCSVILHFTYLVAPSWEPLAVYWYSSSKDRLISVLHAIVGGIYCTLDQLHPQVSVLIKTVFCVQRPKAVRVEASGLLKCGEHQATCRIYFLLLCGRTAIGVCFSVSVVKVWNYRKPCPAFFQFPHLPFPVPGPFKNSALSF